MKELHKSIPYHHEGNPRAERGIGIVRPILNILKEKGGEWASDIKEVAFNYRNSINRITGETPFYLMYGRKCPNVWMKGIMPEKELITPWKEINEMHKSKIENISSKILRKRELSTTETTGVKEGDMVLLKNENRTSKDLPRGG